MVKLILIVWGVATGAGGNAVAIHETTFQTIQSCEKAASDLRHQARGDLQIITQCVVQ
jgi:hypothetical protein